MSRLERAAVHGTIWVANSCRGERGGSLLLVCAPVAWEAIEIRKYHVSWIVRSRSKGFAHTASLMQSCSAFAASAQTESCISLLPADAQHASMAVNCAAQGVVGLTMETRKASAEKSEKILGVAPWISIHFFGLTRICTSFVMGSGKVSQAGTAKMVSTFLRHLNLSTPSQRQTEMATRAAHNKNNAGKIITSTPIDDGRHSDRTRSGETYPPRGQGAGQ